MTLEHRHRVPAQRLLLVVLALSPAACGTGRIAVQGPLVQPTDRAGAHQAATRLDGPTRIDFEWELNEQGSRAGGRGVARIEPPYKARLDLFHNLETVLAASLVGDDLRLPAGAPDDVLPPVELMWATLGVFRPIAGTTLVGGDRLVDGGERLRYSTPQGDELHFEVHEDRLSAVELREGETLVQWVRLEADPEGRYPLEATYRNLVDFRELKITRTSVASSEAFDPDIWDLGR